MLIKKKTYGKKIIHYVECKSKRDEIHNIGRVCECVWMLTIFQRYENRREIHKYFHTRIHVSIFEARSTIKRKIQQKLWLNVIISLLKQNCKKCNFVSGIEDWEASYLGKYNGCRMPEQFTIEWTRAQWNIV